jgi:hypothetical protein
VKSVQYVFHHVVIKIRQLFLRPAACLTSTLLETGVSANDCKCSRNQRLNVLFEVRRIEFNKIIILYLLGNRPELVPQYFEASLRDLGLDYMDLYLMHTPFAFEHVPGDLHPKNPDGTIRADHSTDLLGVWRVSKTVLTFFKL